MIRWVFLSQLAMENGEPKRARELREEKPTHFGARIYMRYRQTYDIGWGNVPDPNRFLVDPFEFVNLFHVVATQIQYNVEI